MPYLHCRAKTAHLNSNRTVKIKPKSGYVPVLTPRGFLYEGYWANDKREDFGVFAKKLKDKSYRPLYRGNRHLDKRHGMGNQYYYDTHDNRHGYYHGMWKNGLRSGYGRMWYADCSFYDGEWKCDKRNGEGLFVYANGNRYEGYWKNDQKHGLGRFYHLHTGQMQEGAWYEDAAIATTMEDIPWRQTAVWPTEYPIRKIELLHPDKLMYFRELEIFASEEFLISLVKHIPIPSLSQISSIETIVDLKEKYKYV